MENGTKSNGQRLRAVRKTVLKMTREELARELTLADEIAGIEKGKGVGAKFIQLVEEGKRALPPLRAKQIEELTERKREEARQQVEKEGRRFLGSKESKAHPHILAAFLLGYVEYPTETYRLQEEIKETTDRVFKPLGFLFSYGKTLGYHFEPHVEETEEYPEGFYELKKGEELIRRITQDELLEISRRIERYARMEILHLAGEF